MILAPLQKLPNNVGNLGKIIVATGFELLPKVQKNRPIWSHCSLIAFKVFKTDKLSKNIGERAIYYLQ